MNLRVPSNVQDRIYDDAVDEAVEEGYVRQLRGTLYEPPCLDEEVDLEFGDVEEILDDDGNPTDMFTVRVTAKVRTSTVFTRDYDYDLVYGEVTDWEEV